MNIEHVDENIFRVPEDPECNVDPRGLGVLFMDKMRQFKDNVAQIDAKTGATLTHGEVLLRSICVAQNLQKRQIKPDDIITLCSYNSMDSPLPLIAALLLGVRASPLDPSLPKSDFLHLMNLVKPRYIFSSVECVDLIETVIKELKLNCEIIVHGKTDKHIPFEEFLIPTGTENEFQAKPVKDIFDTAIIFFSSGTTGYPKGICAPHYALHFHQENFAKAIDPSVVLVFSTYYWISATLFLIITILRGTARVVVKGFDEYTCMEVIAKYKVTINFMAPVFSYKLTKKYKATDYDTSNFRNLMLSGTKVSEEQLKAVKKLFPHTQVSSVYGMTEANACISYFHTERDKNIIENKILSSGRPTPGLTYKFVDPETGKTVGTNKIGELRIKGKALLTGFYNNPKETAQAFDEDGFFYTGDIAYYDEDYCFFIVDRNKDLIKYQSWHMIPAELEDILLSHPAIKDAAILGLPNTEDGEHVTACIVLKPNENTTIEDIINHYNAKTDGFDRQKLRGGVYFVENIPRTPSGKILRRKLRDGITQGLIK